MKINFYIKSNKAWVSDQTEITGGNSVNINVAGNTHIKGAKIANETTDENGNTIDGGNLTLATNTLSYENIYDEDKAMSIGMGMSAGDNYTTKGVEQKSGSVDYSMHDKEQTNNATIGMGSIIVGGEELTLKELGGLLPITQA